MNIGVNEACWSAGPGKRLNSQCLVGGPPAEGFPQRQFTRPLSTRSRISPLMDGRLHFHIFGSDRRRTTRYSAEIKYAPPEGAQHFPFFLFILVATAWVQRVRPAKPTWINPCVELGGREHAPCAPDMQAVKTYQPKQWSAMRQPRTDLFNLFS